MHYNKRLLYTHNLNTSGEDSIHSLLSPQCSHRVVLTMLCYMVVKHAAPAGCIHMLKTDYSGDLPCTCLAGHGLKTVLLSMLLFLLLPCLGLR